jgi:NAD(P)-dependent dehydrogenase (short-subunit alcohol dehydrogenase family)
MKAYLGMCYLSLTPNNHNHFIHTCTSMSSKPVALILGSGPRVGDAVARQFANTGYSVAVVSRKGTGAKTADGYLSLKADLTIPSSIPGVFDAVKKEFQNPPSVVVYNAAALTPPPAADELFSIPTDSLAADLNTNTRDGRQEGVYLHGQQVEHGAHPIPGHSNLGDWQVGLFLSDRRGRPSVFQAWLSVSPNCAFHEMIDD